MAIDSKVDERFFEMASRTESYWVVLWGKGRVVDDHTVDVLGPVLWVLLSWNVSQNSIDAETICLPCRYFGLSSWVQEDWLHSWEDRIVYRRRRLKLS